MKNKITCLQFMLEINKFVCGFHSTERQGKASNSEIKRWFRNNSIVINGKKVSADSILDCEVKSLVLFPSGRKVTVL